MAYTSSNLVSSIELKSFAPANQKTFSEDEIRALADEVILSIIVPNIITAREDYFVFNKDYNITVNQAEYQIPYRGIGAVLRDVTIIDTNGNIKSVPHIEFDDQSSITSGTLFGYFIRDDQLVLHRMPSSTSGTLRLSFFLTPGSIVSEARGAVISAINTSTNVVTVSVIPSTWVTGNSFDLISGQGSHAYRNIDLTSSLISGTDITLSSLPTNLVVGDYINLAGESSVIQLPSPYRAVLAKFVAAEMLEASNQPSADRVEKKAEALLKSALGLITPRVRGDVKTLPNNLWY